MTVAGLLCPRKDVGIHLESYLLILGLEKNSICTGTILMLDMMNAIFYPFQEIKGF
jgi:hypothetical protein